MLSRYSTMTRESNSALPSSSSNTGTLPSGLNSATRLPASQGRSSSSGQSIFFSASTTRTLRANGLVSEAISFMMVCVLGGLFRGSAIL
ncbi:hypothetical protein D3C78_1637110 [compost metagenome]